MKPPVEKGEPAKAGWRQRLNEVVFEAETRAGRIFDTRLIGMVFLSVITVVLESMSGAREIYGRELQLLPNGSLPSFSP